MHPLHGLIEQLNWVTGNFIYNLRFIPMTG
jgi:hypothetical protein